MIKHGAVCVSHMYLTVNWLVLVLELASFIHKQQAMTSCKRLSLYTTLWQMEKRASHQTLFCALAEEIARLNMSCFHTITTNTNCACVNNMHVMLGKKKLPSF